MKKNENKTKIESKNDENIVLKFNKKNLIKGVGLVVIVFAVLGLAFLVSNKTNAETKTFEFTEITIDEYLEKMNASEKSIIYIARPGCTWCQKQSPITKRLGSSYDLTIYYLNTDNVTSDEAAYEKFRNSAEQYSGDWGTPNTIIVQGGKIVDGIFGYAEADNLKDLFVRNGFINE